MLFGLPVRAGAVLTCLVVAVLLFTNTYRRLERIIIGFVSLIGLSFVYELTLVPIEWGKAAVGWIRPEIPDGSMLIVMSVLGAVVMPHNLFLHSEVIQSRQWNLEDEAVIRRQLDYEYYDTLFSMIVGWAINSAMILLARPRSSASGPPWRSFSRRNRCWSPCWAPPPRLSSPWPSSLPA
jgi:manganese transport protein